MLQCCHATAQVLDTKLVVDRRPGKNTLAPVRIAEALVGDETGVVVMTAKNEQRKFCL